MKLFFSNLNRVPKSNKVVAIIRKILADYNTSQKKPISSKKSQSPGHLKLYYGVTGALSVFEGFGGIIAVYGMQSKGDVKDIFFPNSNFSLGWGKDKDKPMELYDSHKPVHGLGLQDSFNLASDMFLNIGAQDSIKPNSTLMFYRNLLLQWDQMLVVHFQPKYTQFPDKNRFYKMFNWFLFKEGFNLDSNIPIGDLLASLNLMRQYDNKETTMPPVLQPLKNLGHDANPKLVQTMISAYNAGKRLVIDWSHFPPEKFYENKIFSEPESMEIFKALNQLPKEIAANYSIGINPRNADQMMLHVDDETEVPHTYYETEKSKHPLWDALRGKKPVIKEVQGTKTEVRKQEITAPLNLVVIDVPFDKAHLNLEGELKEGKIVFVKWNDLFT